jgi:glyoxylase-like metal-dependent hydrolase (beta-lactamase superfamily II)
VDSTIDTSERRHDDRTGVATGISVRADGVFGNDRGQWLVALARVRALAPGVLVPGHGKVLEGGEIEREVARVEQVLRDAIGAIPATGCASR